jgi:hypothetical protein
MPVKGSLQFYENNRQDVGLQVSCPAIYSPILSRVFIACSYQKPDFNALSLKIRIRLTARRRSATACVRRVGSNPSTRIRRKCAVQPKFLPQKAVRESGQVEQEASPELLRDS